MTEEILEEKSPTFPAISIVMAAHDHERELEQHLPILMEQDYPAGFEVIVVVSKGEDATDDLLERWVRQYPNLYTTFVPDSSRYMSKKKLAVTLGVKAANYEWVLLTEPECVPASKDWLSLMASHISEGIDMVIGYSNYNDEASDYQRYERAMMQRRLLKEADKTAYRTEGHNLLFRKDMFMNGRGFDGNTQYVRGEFDFLVNKYAERGNSATEQSPEAWLIEDAPTEKKWVNRHLYYMCTRKHLKRSFLHRLPYNIIQTLKHIWYVVLIAAAIVSGILQEWIYLGIAIALLLLTLIVHAIIGKQQLKPYEPEIPALKIVGMDLSRAWRALYYKYKYFRADKYDFTSHKL